MENKYAVVKVVADGVNPEVHTFNNKEKARGFLKEFWTKTKEEMWKDYGEPCKKETWCDTEGDCARITYKEDDWIYFQVVDVKNVAEV